MRAARREAERTARSLRRQLHRADWCAAAVTAASAACGTAGLLGGPVALLLGWPALVLGLAAGWALLDARRRHPPEPAGVQLHLLSEATLHEHLATVADDVGVRCPSEVWVVPEPETWLEADPDRPVLHLGGPLLWHLDMTELDRLVAGPLSRMRAVLDAELRPGLRLAARLDTGRLAGDRTPIVGVALRRLGRRLEARSRTLHAAVHEWADSALPQRLRATQGDLAEQQALREVDEIEQVRGREAHAAGVGLRSLALGSIATLEACEREGVLEPRLDHAVVRPAASLLADPDTTDRWLSQWVAVQHGRSTVLIDRHELPARVWMRVWRRELAAGLPAVVHLTGCWPRTLEELFAVLRRAPVQRGSGAEPVDRVPLLGALLSGRPERLFAGAEPEILGREADRDEAGDRARHAAVIGLLAAAVRVAAVDQGRLELGWHDVWGAQVVDHDGAVLALESLVADAVARRDLAPLTAWLSMVGVSEEVPWSDGEPPADGLDPLPICAFTAREGDHGVDVVLLDGWLLGYPHARKERLRDLVGRRAAGDTSALLELARTHRDVLVDVADQHASSRLCDVTAARLDGAPGVSGWTLRLVLPDRRLDLTGSGPAGPLAAALGRSLGDRLEGSAAGTSGSERRSRIAAVARVAGTVATVLAVAAVLLAGFDLAPLLPGSAAGAAGRSLSAAALGLVPLLALRVVVAEADRAARRRGGPPRLPLVRPRREG